MRDYKRTIWKAIIITNLYCASLLQADVQFEGMGFLSESFSGGLALSVHGSLNRVALLYSRKVALSSVPGLRNRPEDMGDILK